MEYKDLEHAPYWRFCLPIKRASLERIPHIFFWLQCIIIIQGYEVADARLLFLMNN